MIVMPGDLDVRAPFADESLDGYVAEVTSKNDLYRTASISRWGGIEHGHRPTLTTARWDSLDGLAEVLETDVGELRRRSYPRLAEDTTRRAFFGSTVHIADIQTRIRRFAPAALRDAPYHRALWQLRIPFDIETGEVLQEACHKCGAIQRWRFSVGVRFCDSCIDADLADAPSVRIPDEALEGVRNAVGLVHPDDAKRALAQSRLPERFRGVDGGFVLDLVLRLAQMMHEDCRWEWQNRLWRNDPVVLAVAMARAWEALADWPRGLRDRISAQIATNEKRFSDGNGGDTIRFLRQRDDAHAHPFVAAAAAEVHDLMNLNGPRGEEVRRETIGNTETAKLVGVSTKPLVDLRRGGALRTIAVFRDACIVANFDRAEMNSLSRTIRRRWDLNRGTAILGIPRYGLEQLVAMKELVVLGHPYFEARYGAVQTTAEGIDRLRRRIVAGAGAVSAGHIPIAEALWAVSGGLKPWGPVVRAMIGGRVRYHLVEVGPDEPLTAAIHVDRGDVLAAAAEGFDPQIHDFAFSTKMTKRDAGEVLNLAPREYTELLKAFPTSSAPTVEVEVVEQIARDFISTLEICARSGLSVQQVRVLAKEKGVRRDSLAGYPRAIAEERLLPRIRPAAGARPDR